MQRKKKRPAVPLIIKKKHSSFHNNVVTTLFDSFFGDIISENTKHYFSTIGMIDLSCILFYYFFDKNQSKFKKIGCS